MSYSWIPIMGEFDTTSDPLVFKGRRIPEIPATEAQPQGQPEMPAAVGIVLSNIKMVNGRVCAKVKFEEITPFSVCELIVGYDLRTEGLVTAGLGGNGAMFGIREWLPGGTPQQGGGTWKNWKLGGNRANLKPNVLYGVGVRVLGSSVTLDVDGVEVVTATLAAATSQPRQVGVFCASPSEIAISAFSADVERPRAFIVMEFSSPYNEVYSHVIKQACEECAIEAIRADEIYGPGIIIKDVIDRIAQSQVVIADISPANANVYFEVGYALALGKPIILLAQRRTPENPLPFDLSAFRVLFYDDSIGGKPKLEAGLRVFD